MGVWDITGIIDDTAFARGDVAKKKPAAAAVKKNAVAGTAASSSRSSKKAPPPVLKNGQTKIMIGDDWISRTSIGGDTWENDFVMVARGVACLLCPCGIRNRFNVDSLRI